MFLIPRTLRALALALLLPLFLLGGCATTHPSDPLEPMNRVIYKFNDGVDTAIVRPFAEAYQAVLPSFVRTGISNFFSNINDVLVALNNLLQGKVVSALSDLGRVVVNTTIGIGGIFDIATEAGLEKHNEDFGQTLGYWGIGDGPYLILPLLGPSNLRDAVGRVVEAKLDPITYVRSMRLRNSLWGLRFANQRAELLDTSKILETASLDPYEFLRDAYLQRRRNLIFDGSPPREKDDDTGLQSKPRADAPLPAAAAGDTAGASLGTPLNAEAPTPARADAQETAPTLPAAPVVVLQPPLGIVPEADKPLVQRTEPQAEIRLPTAAGSPVEIHYTEHVARVWVPTAE